MKHIHIVEPYHSRAMARLSAPLMALDKLYRMTAGEKPNDAADLNYHIPWHTMTGYERKGNSKHVIVYTHCNPPNERDLLDACERADKIVCMSFTGRRELIERGVDPKRLHVIYSAADNFGLRPRRIGIVGYEQPNGRKRSHILVDLAWLLPELRLFEFHVAGKGWDHYIVRAQQVGMNVVNYHDIPDDELQKFYAGMDLLLVTGYIEGGPLPVLEALACGVPVLSPPFGYAKDLLDRESLYENEQELAEKLQAFIKPVIERQMKAHCFTWQDYVDDHVLLFGETLDDEIELDPISGAKRYYQLLQIIDEIKPKNIVEIGTWRGKRAVQMLQRAAQYERMEDLTYIGFDLFEQMTPETMKLEFSKYAYPEASVSSRIKATGAKVKLIAGDTNQTLQSRWTECMNASLIFIDGGHSEKTIASDWLYLQHAVDYKTTIVFDDYYHGDHPEGMGCNSLIDNLDRQIWNVEYLPVQTISETGLIIGMAKVRLSNAISLPLQEQTRSLSCADLAGGWQPAHVSGL